MKGFHRTLVAISVTLAVSLLPNTGFAKAFATSSAASDGPSSPPSVVTFSPKSQTNAPHPLILEGPTWSCVVAAFGSKIYSGQTLGGSGYTSCTEGMRELDLQVHAEYCAPILWGCVFQDEGPMGINCNRPTAQIWCPTNQAYPRDVSNGQLWAVVVTATAIDYEHNIATGTASEQVQF